MDLFTWWSIISTVISLGLAGLSIWQYLKGKYQEEKTKSQIKIWMQDANGLQIALNRIVSDNLASRYSTTNDICNSIFAVQALAFSLHQSLYEERCVDEKEYKERQKKIAEVLESKQLAQLQQNTPES